VTSGLVSAVIQLRTSQAVAFVIVPERFSKRAIVLHRLAQREMQVKPVITGQ
jgi:hypothetical protein